jgi:Zn-dependent peptidase ImmA (M78 family)
MRLTRGRWHIAVNSDDQPTRRRFTLAHEFKHVLDHPFVGVIYRDAKGKPSDDQAERMCDYFAACRLMPRIWVKRAWGDGINDQRALAALFDVSATAMSIRLEQLGLSTPRRRYRQAPEMYQPYLRRAPILVA